jgi:hypothetical protein
MIGIGAVVIAAAVAAGAVAAGILGPRLHRRRVDRGRMGPERCPGFDFGTASGDVSTALGPVEAKRNTGQVLPGTGA